MVYTLDKAAGIQVPVNQYCGSAAQDLVDELVSIVLRLMTHLALEHFMLGFQFHVFAVLCNLHPHDAVLKLIFEFNFLSDTLWN